MTPIIKKKIFKPRGLTLVELVVALGLFAALTLVAVRVYTKIIDIQDRTRDAKNIEGDLRYALGVFTDETQRVSKHIATDTACGGARCSNTYFCINGTSDRLYLRDKNNVCVQYYRNVSNQLEVDRGGTTYAITSDDITVDHLKFVLSTYSDRVVVQLGAVGSMEYNKHLYYQTAIANTALAVR